ncbi:acyltransferase [Candidatus Peregrinibacteria bacterium HGW-Peregrinibacteria-1]|jgi:acetyltransferase-like isoleucine patch superfamily enzyme|nr:MAG: acyltransferase [Candidatus Peregrinibacteria bacterium HGW-Peregrinibacteria-1]
MKKQLALALSKIFIAYYKVRYVKKIHFGKSVIINHKFKVSGPGQLFIGDNVNLWAHEEPNSFNFYHKSAVIKVGANSRLNGLTCHCAESIEIGDNCLIGSSSIMDTDFHTFDDPDHILYGNPKVKSVKIGNQVWLCGQSAILKGCLIGNHSVVGFRAVVTKSFPENVVIAGNPAKVVKSKGNALII